MSSPTAKKLIDQIEATGRKPQSYSGRGMYGKHCVGVALDQYDSGGKLPKGASTDSLGMGTIWYWPNVAAPKELE